MQRLVRHLITDMKHNENGNEDSQGHSRKVDSRGRKIGAPSNLREWMIEMEGCPIVLRSVARTSQKITLYQNTLARWKEAGRPDPEAWLESDVAASIRSDCDCS